MYLEKKISATMRERKRMDVALKIKSLDAQGRFAGYASVFNIVDNQRDIMLRGAFSQSIHKGVSNVKFLWQHNQEEPIGILDLMKEDEYGLYVQGTLLLNVQRANEAHSLLKAGAISGLSIGYSPVRYSIDPDSGVRLLAEVDLWEISLVTFPANSEAQVTMIKSEDPMPDEWKRGQLNGQVLQLAEALDRALYTLQG
jgi:HK97 family phage prohead protease